MKWWYFYSLIFLFSLKASERDSRATTPLSPDSQAVEAVFNQASIKIKNTFQNQKESFDNQNLNKNNQFGQSKTVLNSANQTSNNSKNYFLWAAMSAATVAAGYHIYHSHNYYGEFSFLNALLGASFLKK